MKATGNVIIKSPDLTIYADKVEYFQKQDKANAIGNVLIKKKRWNNFRSPKNDIN